MSRDYLFTFGSGNPATRASLSPTFISFVSVAGVTQAPPVITETYAGTGFYKVNYTAATTIFFTLDGATTGLQTSERYIAGVFDPQDMFGQTLTGMAATLSFAATSVNGIGSTLSALNANITAYGGSLGALIGTTASSFGSTSIDPTTLFGFLKRAQETTEGNAVYTKATGIWDFYSRGSSTLLREKTISDTTVQTTKT